MIGVTVQSLWIHSLERWTFQIIPLVHRIYSQGWDLRGNNGQRLANDMDVRFKQVFSNLHLPGGGRCYLPITNNTNTN